jgi:16S rRNA (uracil1498-N3)-methyltransferase
MPDFRCFAPVTESDPAEIVLSPDESHHLVRVNRARPGDPIIVFNGQGLEWVCECTEADRRKTRLQVREQRQIAPPPYRITLAQALPKGKTFDQIIRKATEIGVARIIPLVTERTEVRLDEARRESKHDKWEATAIEAAKQSGNSFLPEIAPVQSMTDFLEQATEFDLKLIASLHPGARSLRPAVEARRNENNPPPANPVWLIGPEGDFTAEEVETAIGTGFLPITLGRLVLRCDTAATYALSILSYELQNHTYFDR